MRGRNQKSKKDLTLDEVNHYKHCDPYYGLRGIKRYRRIRNDKVKTYLDARDYASKRLQTTIEGL